jgi:hypothetical protein
MMRHHDGEASADTDYVPAGRSWAVLLALVLAEAVSSFEASMIYAALKQFYTL